jgi:hypothetical protein
VAKNVLIYYDRPAPSWRYLPWLLQDPVLVAEAGIRTKARVATAEGADSCPDLSAETISENDLVIVPYRHRIKAEYLPDLAEYLVNGGALLLVQPLIEPSEPGTRFWQSAGMVCLGQARGRERYSFSIVAEDPAARILGVPSGRSAYPHSGHTPQLDIDPLLGRILTRTGEGRPDLALSSQARFGVVATDAFNDLEAYEKSGPDYYAYRRNLGFLVINAVRHLLGYELIVQPIQRPQQRWSELSYAYAAGREYVSSVRTALPERLSVQGLSIRLGKADGLVREAMRSFLAGSLDEGETRYAEAVMALSDCMRRLTKTDRYLIRGWQANALFDHDYGGGLVGYAQTEWVDLLFRWMAGQLEWVRRAGARRVHGISSMTWEIMAKYYPDEVREYARATQEGLLEAVSGLYSQAYLPLISGESNVRQLLYGHRALQRHLGTRPEVFLEPRDHFNFHPQSPQILKGFGIGAAVLRCLGHLGEVSSRSADKVLWRGLDGTELEAVPTYEGIPNPSHPDGWLDPELLAAADRLGRRAVLLGDSFDATFDFAGEKEHTILNAVAPVAGKWATAREFFASTPAATDSCYFDVDDLYAKLMEVWSSFGCLNEAYEWNRTTESLVLAAERFSAIAGELGCGEAGSQDSLKGAWKSLLATQDRMIFGAVNYEAQEPGPLEPGETGKHYWGYQLPPLPERERFNTMGMENLQEMLGENYAGPMPPVGRYSKAKECVEASQRAAREVLHRSLDYLAGSVDAGKAAGAGLVPVVVFNQLGWRKRDVVIIDKTFAAGRAYSLSLTDGEVDTPWQLVAEERHLDGSLRKARLLFLADVPPLGYKTYFLRPSAEKAAQ